MLTGLVQLTLDYLLDGAGLFCGVLKHLLDRGPDCPKVMAATHFHDVFREDLLDPESVPIAFLHMQVMFEKEDATFGGRQTSFGRLDTAASRYETPFNGRETPASRLTTPLPSAPARGEKITYLYRVAEGLSLNSHAAQCAEIFGLPAEICARAQYVRCGAMFFCLQRRMCSSVLVLASTISCHRRLSLFDGSCTSR